MQAVSGPTGQTPPIAHRLPNNSRAECPPQEKAFKKQAICSYVSRKAAELLGVTFIHVNKRFVTWGETELSIAVKTIGVASWCAHWGPVCFG